MASSREPQVARSQSHHRLSLSSATSHNVPIRHTVSRHHSHSVSLGSVNPSHRVTRRKSMVSSVANNSAAIAAAIKGAEDQLVGAALQKRRSASLKHGGTGGPENATFGQETGVVDETGRTGDLLDHREGLAGESEYAVDGSIIIDEHTNFANSGGPKARARRASEGAHLSRREGKRASGEVRCEKCGKGYKHSSCLTKHLWEHTPEWTYTSKLLISKHQQVQLLEAATVLVGMNHDPSAISESAKTNDSSDHSSASPAASGSSELHDDDYSSTETTPPPTSEHAYNTDGYSIGRPKRHSSASSAFSRSYQSAPSSSLPSGQFPPTGTSFGNPYQTFQRRPSTSGAAASNYTAVDDEEASLVAAVESLCSFGTPRSGPVQLPLDVPPVPPLPARFAGQNNRLSLSSITSLLQPDFSIPPPTLTHRISDERDVNDEHPASHGRSDEDDDGIFGRMET